MTLAGFASEKRSLIFDALARGLPPPEGSFDEVVFKDGKDKGHQPQMGATRFEPDAVVFEFIYPHSLGAPILLSVRLPSPERIVFMPVPEWVVESVWEGEVSGTFRFRSEAETLLGEFRQSLEPAANAALFESRSPIGRH